MKKNNNTSIKGNLFILIFLIIGIVVLYFTGFFQINNYQSLYDYFYKHGFEAIVSLFFIGITFYVWIYYIINTFVKPVNDVLYLKSILDETCLFLDKKGRKFYFENNNYEIEKYYLVLRTRNFITEVISISPNKIKIKEKVNYWMNFYSPIGKFEDMLLIPIVYILLLVGLLSLFMSKGNQKIYALIFLSIPLFILIYDLIYKIKKTKSIENGNDGEVDDSKIISIYGTAINVIRIIISIILAIIIIGLFINFDMIQARVLLFPFCLCAVVGVFQNYFDIKEEYQKVNVCEKIYKLALILYVIIFVFLMVYYFNKVCN